MELKRDLVEPGRRAVEDVWETEVIFGPDEKLLEDAFVERLAESTLNANPSDPSKRVLAGYFIRREVLDFILAGTPASRRYRSTEVVGVSPKYL